METVTSVSTNILAITGSGFFSSDLTTTPNFIDPNSVEVLYVPGSAASYICDFSIDAPTSYTAAAEMGNWSAFSLGSFETGYVFRQNNQNPAPVSVAFDGILPAGHYFFSAGAGVAGAPFNGHEDGTINSFTFAVQVPEPVAPAVALLAASLACTSRGGQRRKTTNPLS